VVRTAASQNVAAAKKNDEEDGSWTDYIYEKEWKRALADSSGADSSFLRDF